MDGLIGRYMDSWMSGCTAWWIGECMDGWTIKDRISLFGLLRQAYT